jgi:23S rRNA pseudouridine2604 synthase
LIRDGRVTINDELASIASRISDEDIVAVDFEIIKSNQVQDTVILAYNKPPGLTSTTDTHDASSILNFIKYPKRVFPIGRLDKDSEGLILLTNNGDIVNKILRSSNNNDKEYWVTLKSAYNKEFLEAMANGVDIDGGRTKPCKVRPISARKFSITLTQGMNRQIRKMCKELGMRVDQLQRVRVMNVFLGELGLGKLRRLTEVEQKQLLADLAFATNNDLIKRTRRNKNKLTIVGPFAPQEVKDAINIKNSKKSNIRPQEDITEPAHKKAPARKGSFKAYREKGRKR